MSDVSEASTDKADELIVRSKMKRILQLHWHHADDRQRALRVVQPGLIGLIDGTISTLAPIFAAAYLAGSRAALLIGIASALGAAVSMGVAEAFSDDGQLTNRGSSLTRGAITGVATFIGGSLHTLPFIIDQVDLALAIAYCMVCIELIGIAVIRKRFMQIPLRQSLIQITAAGIIVAALGAAVGHA